MAEYLEKMTKLDQVLDDPKVHQQVSEVQQIVQNVADKELLEIAPGKLGFLPDEFEELVDKLGQDKKQELYVMNQLLNSVRQYLSLRFGIWSVPNLKLAKTIKEELQVQKALEVMAGNGYWSLALKKAGLDMRATDSLEWAKTSKTGQDAFFKVENFTAVEAVEKFNDVDLIICSWAPNFTQSDLELVKAWKDYNPKSKLIFIGECEGVTNSPDFWEQMKFVENNSTKRINQQFSSFDFIEEKVYLVK